MKNASVKIECTICVTNECNANFIPNDVNDRCTYRYDSKIYKIWKQFQSLNTKYNMKTLPLASITFRDSVAKDSYNTARNTSLTHITLKPSNEGAGLSMTLWSVAIAFNLQICRHLVLIFVKRELVSGLFYLHNKNWFPESHISKLVITSLPPPPQTPPYYLLGFMQFLVSS